MRVAHGSVPFRAVAAALQPRYPQGMNSTLFIHPRSDTAPPANRGHVCGFDEAHLIKKALLRWENEGGKIPELAPPPPKAGTFPEARSFG